MIIRGLFLFLILFERSQAQYESNWDSLDSRPLPPWYDQAKVGIFLHWGVYSVPFGAEWFWKNWKDYEVPAYIEYMENNFKPNFTYQEFAPMFTAEFFDPEEWAELFNASGARYVVLTSKHHEGYTLWPSKYSWGWNSMDVGPHRDLVGDLASALRSSTPHIHFGLYHSLYEWFNPLFLDDKNNGLTTNNFVANKVMPELYELVNSYAPEVVWSDGEWEAPDWYWNSTVFLAWLFNESPVNDSVVVNDRWGSGTLCKHGSFYTCADRYNPGVLQEHKWENAMSLDQEAWGYRPNASLAAYITPQELVTQLVQTISCGGNILINVGPRGDGRIPPIMEERLRQLGSWLNINGEAVYESQPWTHQNDSLTPGVWYTEREGVVYGFLLQWPAGGTVVLGSVKATVNTRVHLLGYTNDVGGDDIFFTVGPEGLEVTLPAMSEVTSQWAWVLALHEINPATPAPDTLP